MARYTSTSRYRRRMSAAGKRKTPYSEKVFSPEGKDEIDLTDEILAEEMLPEIMGEPVGRHVKEMSRSRSCWKTACQRLMNPTMEATFRM